MHSKIGKSLNFDEKGAQHFDLRWHQWLSDHSLYSILSDNYYEELCEMTKMGKFWRYSSLNNIV